MVFNLPINIEHLLNQRTVESERIEYKSDWNPKAVIHTMCAFANDFQNLGGGYIVIGVSEENGKPVLPPIGLKSERIDSIQKDLLNLGNSAIAPAYHPITSTCVIDSKTILVLWVPGGATRPYRAKVRIGKNVREWAWYIRKGTGTVKAKDEDERELMSLAASVPFDDRYQQTAQISDLSPHLIREYLTEIDSDLVFDAGQLDAEALGRRMNIVGGPKEVSFPKNVGLMFFNKSPSRFFPATQIDVVYFPDGPGGDHFEEKEFLGPLGEMIRESIDYIDRNYLKQIVIKHPDRPEAERVWNFPLAAIEEAVVNAVYHRSYEIREPIEVRITHEDLVVLSYPGPDRSIRLSDLNSGGVVSHRNRNRRIGEFLKEMELAEGRSTGVPKIFRTMKSNASPRPQFETDENHSYFIVRLPVHPGIRKNDDQVSDHVAEKRVEDETVQVIDNKTGKFTKQMAQQDGDQVSDQVSDQVWALLDVLYSGPLGAAVAMKKLNLKHRTYFRKNFLRPALDLGLIEMSQPDSPRSPSQEYGLSASGLNLIRNR